MDKDDQLRKKSKRKVLFVSQSCEEKLINQTLIDLKFFNFFVICDPSKRREIINSNYLLFIVCDQRFKSSSLIEDAKEKGIIITYYSKPSKESVKLAFLEAFYRFNYF